MQSKFIRNRDTEIKKPAGGGGKVVSGKEIEHLVLIGRTKISQSETFVNEKKTAWRNFGNFGKITEAGFTEAGDAKKSMEGSIGQAAGCDKERAQVRMLLNAIDDIRDDALIRLGLLVGLHVSEVVGIRTSEVDFERGLIKI